jgi:hypothetical protein
LRFACVPTGTRRSPRLEAAKIRSQIRHSYLWVQVLIKQAVARLNSVNETLAVVKRQMNALAASLPEYETALSGFSVH